MMSRQARQLFLNGEGGAALEQWKVGSSAGCRALAASQSGSLCFCRLMRK
jgi:hypothetical protein